jgi:mRNA-degrading endonuclease toxin of MazEF toxin-antitoxin module
LAALSLGPLAAAPGRRDPHFGYLWRRDAERGAAEGKDRPCVVIEVRPDLAGGPDRPLVTLLPITTRPPARGQASVEVPQPVKRRLGLDERRSWVILDEANPFVWPGYDVRPAPGRTSYRHGSLSAGAFRGLLPAVLRAHGGAVAPPATSRDA